MASSKIPTLLLGGCGFTLVCAVVLGLVLRQLLFKHCIWWDCAPSRTFSARDLDLPDSFWPPGTDIHHLQPLHEDFGSIWGEATADYWEGGIAIYIVRRFGTYDQAATAYQQDTQRLFTAPADAEQEYPHVLGFRSDIADESYKQCGFVLRDFRCDYIARYREFTVFFSASVDDGGISEGTFVQIMQHIDERLARILEG